MTHPLDNPAVKVFAGRHTHTNNTYAKDCALTLIVTQESLGSPKGIVCLSFDENAEGKIDVTEQLPAETTFDGTTLTMKTYHYTFQGELNDKTVTGSYTNPDGKVMGSFEASSL